ncbi:MAG: hypothetical protein WC494_03175 [Candidatus Pacearchaeota archaeon]
METIGKIKFGKFESEIKSTPKVIKYLKEENLSLAVLIPNAYDFYEVLLFDSIDEDEDGKPDKKFGNKFDLVYYGITEKGIWNEKEGLKVKGFKENTLLKKNILFHSGTQINQTPKNPKKSFMVNYAVLQK